MMDLTLPVHRLELSNTQLAGTNSYNGRLVTASGWPQLLWASEKTAAASRSTPIICQFCWSMELPALLFTTACLRLPFLKLGAEVSSAHWKLKIGRFCYRLRFL